MTDDTTVSVERRIAAPPQRVYQFLTDSALWARWQGLDATIDARPGGGFEMRSPNGLVARGYVVELVPDQKVVLTWGWVGVDSIPPGSTRVQIELVPDGEGTVVRLTHTGLPSTEADLHRQGWNHYVERLVLVSEGGDPGPDGGVGG